MHHAMLPLSAEGYSAPDGHSYRSCGTSPNPWRARRLACALLCITLFSAIDENNSFSFLTPWRILFLRANETQIEDCPSPDAAPVPAYWLLRRRQPIPL